MSLYGRQIEVHILYYLMGFCNYPTKLLVFNYHHFGCQKPKLKMSSDSDNVPLSEIILKTRKRKSFGRLCDATKHLRNHSYETGPSCKCKRFHCFEVINKSQRDKIIHNFNNMKDRNAQNSYLCGLITLTDIQRRRPRKQESIANLRDHSYKYKVRIKEGESVKELQVCQSAFINLHGITNRRVITLKKYISIDGYSGHDQRGMHKNRPHKIKQETYERIKQHIQSFKGRKSHYSMNKSKKTYLPEDLNIRKMWQLYNTKNNDAKISYDTYRKVFVNDFNISFGYPRSDTCSFCDSQKVKSDYLQKQLAQPSLSANQQNLKKQLRDIETEVKVHKSKANCFYDRKRKAKKRARKEENFEAITMDYSKNLPTPNITTNDVYFKRQLTFISFNVHVLSNNKSVFYTYPQTVAKKGSDEVSSLLYHFCFNYLPPTIRHLEIFCDSCSGQNKNYTIIRLLHFLVHKKKRFDSIKMTFPVRGHSYMECDKDFGLVNQKATVEIPDHWAREFENARTKPCPFDVVKCTQNMFFAWTKYLSTSYRKVSPVATRPIKEIFIKSNHPMLIESRDSYNGAKTSYVIVPKNKKLQWYQDMPDPLYNQAIAIPIKKYNELQDLKQFVAQEHQDYYTNLPFHHTNIASDEEDA